MYVYVFCGYGLSFAKVTQGFGLKKSTSFMEGQYEILNWRTLLIEMQSDAMQCLFLL